jgi:hypothetical protein
MREERERTARAGRRSDHGAAGIYPLVAPVKPEHPLGMRILTSRPYRRRAAVATAGNQTRVCADATRDTGRGAWSLKDPQPTYSFAADST